MSTTDPLVEITNCPHCNGELHLHYMVVDANDPDADEDGYVGRGCTVKRMKWDPNGMYRGELIEVASIEGDPDEALCSDEWDVSCEECFEEISSYCG